MGIDLRPYIADMEELQPGETIRVDHGFNCDAGEETRQRLYLTRVLADPSKVIGYCHNCSTGGSYGDKGYAQYRDQRHDSTSKSTSRTVEVVEPPKGLVHPITDWPTHAQAWAYGNKMDQDDVDNYNIAYDPSTDRVYLPRYAIAYAGAHNNIQLNGYQLRLVTGRGPKYMTVVGEQDQGYTRINAGSDKKYCVVVEDLASGIHIANAHVSHPPVDVVVNYGVKINALVVALAQQYERVQVWLDNDSQHIINQAKHYARTIAMYKGDGALVNVVEVDSDPKHYMARNIRSIMENSWTT